MGKHSKKNQEPEPYVFQYPQAPAALPPVFYNEPFTPLELGPSRNTSATTMVTGEAAVAEVTYTLPSRSGNYGDTKLFKGKGASKRERDDRHDPVTGELLAMARAYDELAARMFREARKRIRVQDNERRQAQLRRTKEEWEQIKRNGKLAADLGLTPADGSFGGHLMTEATVPERGEIDATEFVRSTINQATDRLQQLVRLLTPTEE